VGSYFLQVDSVRIELEGTQLSAENWRISWGGKTHTFGIRSIGGEYRRKTVDFFLGVVGVVGMTMSTLELCHF
jgi:hypothetical protein